MKPLRFLHIPKTAGTTFRSILERQYGGRTVFAFTGDTTADTRRFNALAAPEKAGITLIVGHAPFQTGIAEVDAATTITFMRDPVERVKSFCQHVSEGKSEHLATEYPAKNFNLGRFLASGEPELANLQTKMLVNKGSCEAPEFLESLSSPDAVELALDHLFHKLACFGLQERFDDTLIFFSSCLGWRTPHYKSLNTASKRATLSFTASQIERIADLNRLDLEIYRRAAIRFSENFRDLSGRRWKSKWFRFSNRVIYPRGQWLKWRARGLFQMKA